jgi:hypothetical protein
MVSEQIASDELTEAQPFGSEQRAVAQNSLVTAHFRLPKTPDTRVDGPVRALWALWQGVDP